MSICAWNHVDNQIYFATDRTFDLCFNSLTNSSICCQCLKWCDSLPVQSQDCCYNTLINLSAHLIWPLNKFLVTCWFCLAITPLFSFSIISFWYSSSDKSSTYEDGKIPVSSLKTKCPANNSSLIMHVTSIYEPAYKIFGYELTSGSL